MNKIHSPERIFKTGNLVFHLMFRQYKLYLMAGFLEIKLSTQI